MKENADRNRRANQMAELLAVLPDNYFRLDRHGTVLEYSIGLKPSLTVDPVAHIGCKMLDLMPPGVHEIYQENMKKHLDTREAVTWEYHVVLEGKRRDRESRFCPVEGSDDTIFVSRDITKRRQAEQQRAVAEVRLGRIITSLPGAVLSRRITNSEGANIIYVSAQSVDIWGYTPEEIYATKGILEATLDSDDRIELGRLLTNAAENLEPYSRRYQITTRLGERKWLKTNTSAYRQKDGSILTVGYIMDVTAEVRTQQQLDSQRIIADRAQKLESIGRLTGGMAHDFNNLLAAIMGSLELLRDDETDLEQLSLIDAGLNATRRGADLTRSMLAFARRAALEPCVIDLNTLVDETRNWAGRTLPSSIEVNTSLLAGLWPVKADISSTESALLNLIVNARDAMPEGGELKIETMNVRIDEAYLDARQEKLEPGRYVMLAVRDTGHGIANETLEHIFEPFFTTKAPGDGTGLGLSMILGFMQQSGGTVHVTSEPDVGTTFKLYFKAFTDEVETTVAKPTRTDSPLGHGQQILVAEDDRHILPLLAATLEKAGYDVTTARSGDEALKLFEGNSSFDLLLTDIMMPGSLQGPALSRVIREQAPDLPVVFMSGYASETTVQGNGMRPEDIRLMKPVMRADLLAAIKKSLGD